MYVHNNSLSVIIRDLNGEIDARKSAAPKMFPYLLPLIDLIIVYFNFLH